MASTQQEAIETITEQAMAALRRTEDSDLAKLADAWGTARDGILAKIQAAHPEGDWTLEQMAGTRTAQLLQGINSEIYQLTGNITAGTFDAGVSQYQGAQIWGAYGIDQATPANINANLQLAPKASVRALLATPYEGAMFSQRYGALGDAMASDIRDQLVQSMINGENMKDAAARVKDVLGDASKGYVNRSLTIARTEIIRAQALGALDTFNQNADILDAEPVWMATADDRLCPWCLGRDGKTPSEIEKLHLTRRGKGDPFQGSAIIPLHPHCRCAWAPQLKSWKELGIDIPDEAPDDARSMRGEDGKWKVVPLETFNAWQKRRGQQLGLAA